ncbi:hypothetical protein BD770DRAFT_408685 [Pilaira anomala]|nr:hypothetical protein BD770DRAFT_408685 [Pilaira anomala]
MEDINKAADSPSVIHMDIPDEPSTEPSTEPLEVLASFIPGTELTNRIINTTIWTVKAANAMRDVHKSGQRLKLLHEAIRSTTMYIKGQNVLLLTKNFYQV